MLICYKLILTNYEGLDVISYCPSYVYYQTYRLFGTYGFPPNYQLGGSGGTYEFLLYSYYYQGLAWDLPGFLLTPYYVFRLINKGVTVNIYGEERDRRIKYT